MLSKSIEDYKFIDEGASIIQTIYGKVGQSKIFEMKNNRKEENANYLVDFYSLNCKISITRNNTLIKSENNFSQDLITPKHDYYKNDIYEYILEITEMDNTIKKKPIMFCPNI